MIYNRFDVILVLFPFSERKGAKQRPSIILSEAGFNREHGHALVAMVTTATLTRWPSDLAISDSQEAGLHVPSVIRAKLFTVANELIIGKVGNLGGADSRATTRWLAEILSIDGQ